LPFKPPIIKPPQIVKKPEPLPFKPPIIKPPQIVKKAE
jgi:hypothetical protein